MGTIAASVVIDRAEKTLIDSTNNTWSESEHLDHLNMAITRTLNYKPRDYVVDGTLTLVAGTRQTLPSGGVQVLDIYRTAAGGAITRQNRDAKDHSDRNWHAATGITDILHWYPDEFALNKFLVDPPASNGAQVMGVYAAVPARLTSVSDIIPLPDIRENALWAALVALALYKTTKRGDVARAQFYEAMWRADIGASAEAQLLMFPLPPEETPTDKKAAA